jgi:hypothetical protein
MIALTEPETIGRIKAVTRRASGRSASSPPPGGRNVSATTGELPAS